MNAASKSALTRTQLASLGRLVRCIESGEEAARLRRILADIGEFETENEADVRGRLMELEDSDARQALLTVLGDQVADLEHRMITLSRARVGNLPKEPSPTDCAASERLAVGQPVQSDGTSERLNSADIQRDVGIRGGTLGGVIAALGALAAAAAFWFVAGVVFSLVNLDGDRYLERHPWLTLVFGGSLVFAFLAALAYIAARDGGLPAWTLLLAGIAASVPAVEA